MVIGVDWLNLLCDLGVQWISLQMYTLPVGWWGQQSSNGLVLDWGLLGGLVHQLPLWEYHRGMHKHRVTLVKYIQFDIEISMERLILRKVVVHNEIILYVYWWQCTFLILRPGGYVDKHLLDLFLKIQHHLLMQQTDLLLLVAAKCLIVCTYCSYFVISTHAGESFHWLSVQVRQV